MIRPGWYADPTGRFPHRWHDGHDWTASIVDHGGQQGYDAIPPVGAPPAPGMLAPPQAPAATPVPPPPPGASTPPTPSVRSMWEPAPPVRPGEPTQSWQPGQPWQSAPSQPGTQAYGQVSPSRWQPAPIAASMGLTGSSAGALPRRATNPLGLIVSTVGTLMIALSLFVLDWAPSSSFSDLRTYLNDIEGLEWPDTLVKAYTQWLGYGWLVVTGIAVAFAAGGRTTARRLAHVVAALAAAIGAVLSAFVVVRSFVGPADPEFGAWLLVGGYFVMLMAVVVSARRF